MLTHKDRQLAKHRGLSFRRQAEGSNSEINLKPVAIFSDPFRGAPHVLVLADCYNAWDNQPAIGNTRAACNALMQKYRELDAWFGIEQEHQQPKTYPHPSNSCRKATLCFQVFFSVFFHPGKS